MASVYTGAKWGSGSAGTTGGTVTYAFATPGLWEFYNFDAQLNAAYQAVVEAAFDTWSDYANIEFVLTYDIDNADIRLGWDAIDGASNTLGQAQYGYYLGSTTYYTLYASDIRFDTAENWALTNAETDPGEVSFYAVALHEIGHAIGLDHTLTTDSIMYAFLGDVDDVTPLDIAGIQALYGAAPNSGPPGWGWTIDTGGWNYGWHKQGGFGWGWHVESGWDHGWYNDGNGWDYGWFVHSGYEVGWYGTGWWDYGWYVDYGGRGWGGTNTGWWDYGWYGGDRGHESTGWAPPPPQTLSYDNGGWNLGWHKQGGWDFGWHVENGWDFGWYIGNSGWDFGWYDHYGWESGWYRTGSWNYGWYYDYGGRGLGYDAGGAWGGAYGTESAWGSPVTYGPSIDDGSWDYGWHKQGGWAWGAHVENGSDYGWYVGAQGWAYGWFDHYGSETGWYRTGAWDYGWYYDYGGSGTGWNLGSAWGGAYGNESTY